MRALIDADTFVFQAMLMATDTGGYTFGAVDNLRYAKKIFDSKLKTLLNDLDNPEYLLFFTQSPNYRNILYPKYKQNRPELTKEQKSIREGVKKYALKYPHVIQAGFEADDLIGIYKEPDDLVVSIDKDLNQIEGKHYNPMHMEFYSVDKYEAYRQLYTQVLAGDSVDGFKGLPRVGKVKALKFYNEGLDMAEVYKQYGLQFEPMYGCAKILRKENVLQDAKGNITHIVLPWITLEVADVYKWSQ